jgi:hypothetical protein
VRYNKLREPTSQANRQLRKHPHNGFIQALQTGKMDPEFSVEVFHLRGASLTTHNCFS